MVAVVSIPTRLRVVKENLARFARVFLLPFEHAWECRSRVCRTRSDPDTTVLILSDYI